MFDSCIDYSHKKFSMPWNPFVFYAANKTRNLIEKYWNTVFSGKKPSFFKSSQSTVPSKYFEFLFGRICFSIATSFLAKSFSPYYLRPAAYHVLSAFFAETQEASSAFRTKLMPIQKFLAFFAR